MLEEIQHELEKNPDVDLMSLFHEPYVDAHQRAEKSDLSYAAKYNRETMDDHDRDDWRDCLNWAQSAKAIFPLSEEVNETIGTAKTSFWTSSQDWRKMGSFGPRSSLNNPKSKPIKKKEPIGLLQYSTCSKAKKDLIEKGKNSSTIKS